ncbi:ATP-dependent DNA helicase [Paucibacter sp. APW11]|uniref:ATP-dependent DNA helicase n=1 Tax=Roseateles aquae TaxID=3077235 RepID=A0ABU3PH01_9BURK|nr:ATP-dependent DNA helicase [Paucibacter sp. APW11]MDT9001849.1 ATP-dependent DNA helicase [Paucibacter sp. APW11]
MYSIAVRELCEFSAKRGDLDLRFTPAPSAQEGIAGHALVAQGRAEASASYQAELSLSGDYAGRLVVRGRADGFDPARGRLEEVKTYKGRLDRQPEAHRALHWAQLKVYGWLLCAQQGLDEIELALVYFHVLKQQETVFSERCTAAELRAHFELLCQRFLGWAEQQLAHVEQRNAALQVLAFPFGEFRQGQRALAEAVYRGAASGRCLLAQAPTGIGKTLGTLFPLLKAMPGQRLDKVFFLAAKTSGRQLALDALQRLRQAGAPLRTLELVARDKACEYPDRACHGESCPLAQGFYERLPAARAEAVAAPAQLDQAAVRAIALAHQVCPYYLSQELARWVDVVIGDYNYYFDVAALLHGLTQLNDWRVGLLVDEAHNLLERGRKMYSAELLPETLAEARRGSAARADPALKKALDKLSRAWTVLARAQTEPYAVLPALPDKLFAALQNCIVVLGEHFSAALDDAAHFKPDPALQAFYFEALQLARLAEQLDSHSLVDLSLAEPRRSARSVAKPTAAATLCLRNIVPAPFLRPRLEAAHCATLFSATLQPSHFYADLLGLPEQHVAMDMASPFEASQLQVRIHQQISTRYQHRAASVAPIAALMAHQYTAAPGNYLAFFSSYDYLQQLQDHLATHYPALPVFAQQRRMSEAEQRQFLARFDEQGRAGIGLAVLGGAFAEGIDLPGQRLIGAFVATLGLPQLNPVNEQIRERMEQLFGAGYDYTYLYPGLQKVVQAAGRVIRTVSDQGHLHLIDDRFARREVRALLPAWWRLDGA